MKPLLDPDTRLAFSPSFLHDDALRFLLFGGKGGVGKTTCAASTALQLARDHPEQNFLLVSTDPAHSLLDSLADSPRPVNLQINEFDAQACLNDFKNKSQTKLREIASRGTFLDDEDISQFMALSLPGLDELMAFLEIAGWVEAEKYDRIVVDTAPTGHTLRLLAMPELIQKWLDALDALLAKHRYMKKLFAGSYKRDELDEFLLGLSVSVGQMKTLLTDSVRCLFVPVMLAEALSVHETLMLLEELHKLQIPVKDVIINRLYADNKCQVCSDRQRLQLIEIVASYPKLVDYALTGVPMYRQEILGTDALTFFWEGAFSVQNPLFAVSDAPTDLPPKVNQPADLPSLDTKLLLFAGKGGVGKTTLACASAIRMAQALNGKEVLLFSTDPAHSLSACFSASIGPEPTQIIPGLTAMEIDATSMFEDFKNQYAAELEKFLSGISANLDLTFDRDVMERVMDLAPPGIDEIMALTSIMEFLTQGHYHFFILDSAPTGHLIRLLETPELIDQWLKVFFNLFLKYKHIFRLPKISRQMVQMSKDLKVLRNLLKSNGSSALFGVTILNEMAFEETRDLSDACQRLDVNMPLLFLNLATTTQSACELCTAVCRREKAIMLKYAQAFPGQHQTLVYQRGEPRGLAYLEALGNALYK